NGSYLRRHGNGYRFVADGAVLDVVAFRELVATAESALGGQRAPAALDDYVAAVKLWRGAAGGAVHGAAGGEAALALVAEEFFTVCTAAAELAVSLGGARRVLRPLRLAASLAPFHELVHASLIRVLGAAGQQAEALALFDRVRARLADERGTGPGPAL